MNVPETDGRDSGTAPDRTAQPDANSAKQEDRQVRLAGAQQMNFLLSAIAIGAAIGFYFADAAWRMPSAAVLGVLPLVLIYLVNRDPLSYAILKARRRYRPTADPRTDLGIAFMACAMGLFIGTHGVHFVEIDKMLEYTVLVSLLCCISVYSAARKNPQFWSVMFAMLLLAGAYGWGLASAIDTLPDKSPATNYTTMIENKHESHGRSTSYHLDLAPWGPMQESDDISVSKAIYDSAFIGGPVCFELRPGVLHVQWYRLVPCDTSGAG